MSSSNSRRRFLQTTAAASASLGLGELGFLKHLQAVTLDDAAVDPSKVQFQGEIEPWVRLLEETPREQLLEQVGHHLRKDLSYRELLTALLLAGVRNVQPRPSVGHKFHSVLVVNSAHLASISSPDEHRLLPIFWALDYFKATQAQDAREGDWTMSGVDESAVPQADQARKVFQQAMDNWDEAPADAAIAGLSRSHGLMDIYEIFFRYGARDFRSIGHKAIYVANSLRTLHCIGWQHGEPVLRSLAYALLNHEGTNPAQRDAEADRPYRQNIELVKTIRKDWKSGTPDDAAVVEMLAVVRQGNHSEASQKVIELLNRGVSAQSIWDGLFLASGELMIRQPGIVALHAMTTTNAMAYAYRISSNDETRRLLMLQNAAFLPMFRQAMESRSGELKGFDIAGLQAEPGSSPIEVGEVFSQISSDRSAASQTLLNFLATEPTGAKSLIDTARLMIFLKGTNAHDYKFSSAVLEDYYHISPAWRNRFLAASVYNLRGAGDRENNLVTRTRAALQG